MDRSEFAKRLHDIVLPSGTSPEDMQKIMFPVSEAIFQMMPSSLYKYRSCEERHIEAFRSDTIYAQTADRFNDPYDTLVRFDQDAIKRSVDSFMSYETFEMLKAWFAQGNDFPYEVKQIFPEGMTDSLKNTLMTMDDLSVLKEKLEEGRLQAINLIETYFPILTEMCKRYSAMACFSESVKSVLMWSHYANSHQGFALEYDFRPTLAQPIKNVGLYPVIYDDKRMDVSLYMVWSFLWLIGIKANNPDVTAYLKIALHKSSIWAYEREWRMIDLTLRDVTDTSSSMIHYKSKAIYYGRHISKENRDLLHHIAQEKGIKEYEMYIDYTSLEYEMKWRGIV